MTAYSPTARRYSFTTLSELGGGGRNRTDALNYSDSYIFNYGRILHGFDAVLQKLPLISVSARPLPVRCPFTARLVKNLVKVSLRPLWLFVGRFGDVRWPNPVMTPLDVRVCASNTVKGSWSRHRAIFYLPRVRGSRRRRTI
jgi:hypothetical protein